MPDAASSNLQVPPDLETAGTTVNGTAQTISGQLQELKNMIDPIRATWTGPAQSYFEGLMGEWNIAAEGLFGPGGVLGQISSALNLSWNNYSECEWANLKTWRPAGS